MHYSIKPYGVGSLIVFDNPEDVTFAGEILRGVFGGDLRVGLNSLYVPVQESNLDLSGLSLGVESGKVRNSGREHTVSVDYTTGLDLTEVANQMGRSISDVISLHTETVWTVAMVGFAPGFPYLRPNLHSNVWGKVSRLSSPRTKVPLGAVGVAAGMSCIYPAEMPGGWCILGTTDLVLFDPSSETPSVFSAGDTVRFVGEAVDA